jgi:hypothetical protein
VPPWDESLFWTETASEREVHRSALSGGRGKQFSALSSALDSNGLFRDRVRYEKLGEARERSFVAHSWLITGVASL